MQHDRPAQPSSPWRVYPIGVVSSSNDVAHHNAAQGCPEGALFLAERQTSGRGRSGGWDSPPGNFYASLLLRPSRSGRELASLSLIVAMAWQEIIEKHLAARLQDVAISLKWPNDLLCDGKKIGGILIETGSNPVLEAGPQRTIAVVGMGINLVSHPKGGLRYTAGDLYHESGVIFDPAHLASQFITHFPAFYAKWNAQGFAPFREGWLSRSSFRDEEIEIRLPNCSVFGHYRGLAEDGALVMETTNGNITTIHAGDLRAWSRNN